MKASRATALAFAVGWCFLPVAGYPVTGLPDYTKVSATIYACVVGTIVFHHNLVLSFRPRYWDLPAAILTATPAVSALANEIQLWDAIGLSLHGAVNWTLPYFLGRITIRTRADFSWLFNAILVCGLVYIPLCWWEIRMSPNLHKIVYGFHQHEWAQAIRDGGYRPTVFMTHGLQVALWISCIGIMQFTRICFGPKSPWGIALFAASTITLVFLKSSGAFLLSLVAISVLILTRQLNTQYKWIPVSILIAATCGWIFGRVSGVVNGNDLVMLAESLVPAERVLSLKVRIDNENTMLVKAREKPFLGWGGFGRNTVKRSNGEIVVIDGLWIYLFGMYGTVGIASFYATLFSGSIATLHVCKHLTSQLNEFAIMVFGLSVCIANNGIDSIPNAMVIPIFIVASGALVSLSKLPESATSENRPTRTRFGYGTMGQ